MSVKHLCFLLALFLTAPSVTAAREILVTANNGAGTLTVIDIPSYRVLGEIDVIPDIDERKRELGLRWFINRRVIGMQLADDIKFSPDRETMYISRGSLADVAAFKVSTGGFCWRVPVKGLRANHMNLSDDGKYLYVSAILARRVHVIDTELKKEVGVIRTGRWPHGVEFSKDKNQNFVGIGEMRGGNLVVVDRSKGAEGYANPRFIDFGAGVRPFEFTEDGRVFLQLSDYHGFVEYDLDSGDPDEHAIRTPIEENARSKKWEGNYPRDAPYHGLALSKHETYLAVAATSGNEVHIFDLRDPNRKTFKTIRLPEQPGWIINSLDDTKFYVTSRGGDTVAAIDYATGKLLALIPTGHYPQRMATVRVEQLPAMEGLIRDKRWEEDEEEKPKRPRRRGIFRR